MPIDFLGDDMQNSAPQQGMQRMPRDFLLESEPQKESLGYSAAMAIPRVLTDVGTGAYNAAQKIPGMYESAKTEVPGLLDVLRQHPGHAAMQALAGGQEAINKLAQTPLNLAQYGANRLNLLPQSVPNAIQKITPEDTTQATNQLFGQPQYPGEKLLRGAIADIPELYGATKLGAAVNPKGFLSTKNSIKNTLLKTHDTLENRASKGFKDVSNEVNQRGITQVPINASTIQGLQEYFPKTRSANTLLSKAQTGDYNALRKVQSDLYQKGKQNLGSSLEQDRMRGSEMFEKRDDINQAISDHLVNTGNQDLNHILNAARNDYKTLQNVYYNKNMNNAIVNMVNKDYRKIPKNLVDVLGEQSNPMKSLLNFHPGLENAINKYGLRQNALNVLKKYALPIGAGGAGGYAAIKYGLGKNNNSI